MEVEPLVRRDFARTFEITDACIRSDGSGRIVEAYITPFNRSTEIRDADGHYNEIIGQRSFDKTLAERGLNFAVLYNHGRTYDGRTDGALMVPIGKPLEVRPDERGLFSATEYLENPLADAVLDAVKKGAIRGYSFSGSFIKSAKARASERGGLPTITRSEVAMREYGPVLYPAYADAAIVGTRMSQFLDELDPEEIDRFRQMLGIATPLEPAAGGTSSEAAPSEDPAISGQSTRTPEQLQALIRGRNRLKGIRK